MLVRADAYRDVGGHRAVAEALVDDFALAKCLRSAGYRVALVDGTRMVSCRMYQSAGEVWNGFSKNILLGLDEATTGSRPWWWGLGFAWGYACLFVLPLLHLLSAGNRRLALVEIGWMALLRAVVSRFMHRPIDEVFSTPLAGLGVMALGINAWLRRRRGDSLRWKGREYNLKR
jgi:chlorobactene glucosyltransferase